jgi:hypothetical protein
VSLRHRIPISAIQRTSYVEALEALVDGDPRKVHKAVIRAQRAILNRYLELTAALESRPEEAEDLATAVEVLQAMKRQTRTPVYQTAGLVLRQTFSTAELRCIHQRYFSLAVNP